MRMPHVINVRSRDYKPRTLVQFVQLTGSKEIDNLKYCSLYVPSGFLFAPENVRSTIVAYIITVVQRRPEVA